MTAIASPSATASSAPVERSLGTPARLLVALVGAAGLIAAIPTILPILWYVPYAGIGAILIVRRPRMSIGWLLAGIGLAFVTVSMSIPASAADFANGTLSASALALTVVGWESGPLLFFLFSVLAIVFPSGHLPSGRWGSVTRSALALGLIDLGLNLVMPGIHVSLWASKVPIPVRNPIGLLPGLPLWQVVTPDTAILPIAGLMLGAVVSLFARYRRTTGVERQQLRWITAALLLVVSCVLTGFVVGLAVPSAAETGIVWVPAAFSFPLVPVAVGLAVQRHRLYEIDTIINRTLVYVLMTAVLAGTMAATVAVSRQLFEGLIGGGSEGSLIVSTLVAVSVFDPVKSRVQAFVDRHFKAAPDPAHLLDRYVEELHASASALDVRRTLRGFAATAVWAYHAASATVRHGDGETLEIFPPGSAHRSSRPGSPVSEPLVASARCGSIAASVELVDVTDRRSPAALERALAMVLEELSDSRQDEEWVDGTPPFQRP